MSFITQAALHDILYPGNQVMKGRMPCVVPSDPKVKIMAMIENWIGFTVVDAKIVHGHWYVSLEDIDGWFKTSDLLKYNKHS